MESKNSVNNGASQGESPKKILTIQDVQKMVNRDLTVVTAFLQACQDPDVASAISTYLHGKYMNDLHAKELDSQTKIKI